MELTSERAPTILNVDDYEAGRYAITRILERARFRVREAATGSEALRLAAAEHPDVILLDVNLPDISGFEVCRRIKADPSTARIPIMHISASYVHGSDRARGLEGGADSYLVEPIEPEVLIATVKALLRTRAAEDALRALARQWETTFDAICDGIALVDAGGRLVRWNHALARLAGRTQSELRGEFCYGLWPDAAEERNAFERMAGERQREEMNAMHGGRWFHITFDPVLDAASAELNGAVYIVSDITDRKRLEEQFREAQKFESIGQLAGGVAHDFNNLLTSILGNTSLALIELPPDSSQAELLEEVLRASQRAAELTRQLLAYSGKGRFVLRDVDLSATVRGMRELLNSSVPRKTDLQFDLAPDLPRVEADPAQMQQVLLNLIINAAEAIGDDSGIIRVATAACGDPEAAGLPPGNYVTLEVRDTGHGMDANVKAHLFDPFFTTRFVGRGLGLAAVSGIVRGHHGHIRVESEPGKGATFRVYLPALVALTAPSPSRAVREKSALADTILGVDDEELVRRVAKAALEIRGYRVLLAENGREGVEMVREHGPEISLVLLDMTMPVMGGEEAMEEIGVIAPRLPVVASSGYDELEATRRFGSRRLAGFLQKPYTSRQLAERVRSAIDGGQAVKTQQ